MLRLDEFLTVAEAAEFVGVSPNTIRNWGRSGKIPERRHPREQLSAVQARGLEALRSNSTCREPTQYSGEKAGKRIPWASSKKSPVVLRSRYPAGRTRHRGRREVDRHGRHRTHLQRRRRPAGQRTAVPRPGADDGSRHRRPPLELRRRRADVPAGLRGPPHPAGPPLRSPAGRPHVAGRAAAPPDHGGLRARCCPGSRCGFCWPTTPAPARPSWPACSSRSSCVRGDLQRCLIVCPGNLVEQWQDEMDRRFHCRSRS
jgi:hypothetical protein